MKDASYVSLFDDYIMKIALLGGGVVQKPWEEIGKVQM